MINIKISNKNRPSLCSSNWVKAIYKDIRGDKFFTKVDGLVRDNKKGIT